MCCTCLKPGETKLDSNLPNPNPKTRYCCFSSLLRQRWCALTNFQKLKHLEVKVTPLHQTTDDFFIERVQRERERERERHVVGSNPLLGAKMAGVVGNR